MDDMGYLIWDNLGWLWYNSYVMTNVMNIPDDKATLKWQDTKSDSQLNGIFHGGKNNNSRRTMDNSG